jgi:hypothetical protein
VEPKQSPKQAPKQQSKQPSKQPPKQSFSPLPKPWSVPVPTRAMLAVIALLMAGAAVAYLAIEPAAVPAVEAAHAATPTPMVVKQVQIADEESLAWERMKRRPDTTAQQVDRFIAQYPNGKLIDEARASLAALQVSEAARQAPAVEAAGAASGTAAAVAATPTSPGGSSVLAQAVGAAALAPGATEKPASAQALTAIGLSIKPWGNVVVDGVDRGVSPPLRKLMLADGRHTIRITNPGFPDHVSEIEVGKKKPAHVTVDFVPK